MHLPTAAAPSSSSPTISIARALAALPDLATRRDSLRALFERSATEGARALGEVVRGSMRGERVARDASLVCMSTLVAMERASERVALAAIRDAALEVGDDVVATLLADAPAHRALAPRGRLFEICLAERAPFLALPHDMTQSCKHRLLVLGVERWGRHDKPLFIQRLLRERWLRVADVLGVASRRPTTPAIAYEIAANDAWIRVLSVRESMAQNPFTPTRLTLALLPTIRRRVLLHLRDVGDAHPLVSAAARMLLALGSERHS